MNLRLQPSSPRMKGRLYKLPKAMGSQILFSTLDASSTQFGFTVMSHLRLQARKMDAVRFFNGWKWKIDHLEDVFPIKHGQFVCIAMLVYRTLCALPSFDTKRRMGSYHERLRTPCLWVGDEVLTIWVSRRIGVLCKTFIVSAISCNIWGNFYKKSFHVSPIKFGSFHQQCSSI